MLARSRSAQIIILVAVVLAASFARTATGPVQEALRVALSLSDNQVALLQGPAMALPIVLAAIPLGVMLDRYCRTRLLVIFAVSFMLGNLLTALANSFSILLIARCVIGLTATATLTAAFSLLADFYAPEQRGRVSMLLAISQMAGNSSAFAAGGALLTGYGSSPEAWRWTLLWLTLPILVIVCSLAALREPPRGGPPATDNIPFHQVWRARARCLSGAPLLVGMVLMEMIFGALYVWGAPGLARSFSFSPGRVGNIMASAMMISGFLGPVLGGILADRCQRKGGPQRSMLMLGLIALVGVPLSLFAFVPSAGLAGVVFMAFMAIVSAGIVMGTAIFTVVTPIELRGLCMAVWFGAATLFGLGVAPVTVSMLSSLLGGESMMGQALSLFSLAATSLGAAAFGLSSQRFHRMWANQYKPVPHPGR